jgi:hypothetical protein
VLPDAGRFVAFQTRFQFPSVASGADPSVGNLYVSSAFTTVIICNTLVRYYSFNVGPAHIVMLCSYCPYQPNTPQYV